MPSFDVVSKIDQHELTNALDQCNREIANRFDFKGTNSRVEHAAQKLTVFAPAKFQVNQVKDILETRLAKRGIDVRCLKYGEMQEAVNEARIEAVVREGIDADLARKIVKLIKDSKMKVQAQIQGDQLRVTGKKKDDLQEVIALLRGQKLELPLQFTNFRD
ncbi:MAG TPA: YajQ family cyclic di-GMP-binding protein [Gammaproteobacteria bacterium]|jgi:uncharacterized protein YajQ (UPF0234 family)